MNKKLSYRYRNGFVLVFFALALIVVGTVLRTRIGMFVRSYTESQIEKQAETHAQLMAEKLATELENLEYIAGRLEASLDDLDGLMPKVYVESGVVQGLLSIDGEALYGEPLDFSVFEGIQSSFRGEKAMTYVTDKGLLFTCPVFNGPNIRYVLYRLCPDASLEERFATEIYEDLGKFCVTTRDGHVVVPFYGSSEDDMKWYESTEIQDDYRSMHKKMEVSIAAAGSFSTDRGEMVLFESEIPGTDFLVSGFVPREVASEGIENLTALVAWVFGFLMLLVVIGAFYLTKVSIKAHESEELMEAKALAEEASRAKSDFLANMSHEIRTPINAVLGMNEMILRESRDDVITTYASNIKAAGTSLLGLINDILDFSKIEAGKIEIIPVEYSVPNIINEVVNMIRNRAEDKGLNLMTEFDPGIPRMLFGDEARIKQIIINLMTNAVKYTEKGSVTFGMSFKEKEDDKDAILLSVYVKDTGIGIKTEDLEKLFREFERIEEKRNRNIEGTGLGMSIIRNLLEMMGSSLKVESVYGQGSCFSFELEQKVIDRDPLGDYEASISQQLAQREQYHERFTAPDARILVVDDNEMNLVVFRSLVKQTEVQTDTALSGDDGIICTLKTKYDIIFLDHMMPEKDGIETLHEMKSDEDNKNLNTPFICLTANAISGAKEKYLEAGFDDYLTKPIDPGRLEEMMLRFLPDTLVKKVIAGPDDKTGDVPDELAVLKNERMIDIAAGIKNNGSAEAYLTTLRVYYDSIDTKAGELENALSAEDIKTYTIKVHALKSSLRIIGAEKPGKEAQRLEDAGKDGNTDYIREHHGAFMRECLSLKEPLGMIFEESGDGAGKPEAGSEMMADALGMMKAAAEEMDCDAIEQVFKEMSAYKIPEDKAELWEKLKKALEAYDYDGISALL